MIFLDSDLFLIVPIPVLTPKEALNAGILV